MNRSSVNNLNRRLYKFLELIFVARWHLIYLTIYVNRVNYLREKYSSRHSKLVRTGNHVMDDTIRGCMCQIEYFIENVPENIRRI